MVTITFFLFTNCTATSVLFINFFLFLLLRLSITVDTCYCVRMRMRVPGVYTCPRVKCLCPVSIEWSCEDGVIRVVSYLCVTKRLPYLIIVVLSLNIISILYIILYRK